MSVLIVEDSREISDLLSSSLEAECFAVDAVQSGEDALMLSKEREYDCIVLDNILPKRSGLEVCKELRKLGNRTPIIMLSVKSDTETKVALLDAGGDDYLAKPFAMEELVARIRALMRRTSGIEGDELVHGGIVLDAKKHMARKNGKDLQLTRREFMLLEYLLRNRGAVLTRAMILNHVWEMDIDPFSNTIETHINCLRHKVGAETIRTVRGIGYTIE